MKPSKVKPMEFNFEGLMFRSSSMNDLSFICRIESDSENSRFILPWSADKHEAALQNDDVLHSTILFGGVPVGFFILAGLTNPNESIEFTRVVISAKGKGVGRKTLKAVKFLCFEKFNAHRLWLDVKTFNNRAKHLYQSEGFAVEGTLRDCLKAGQTYESLIVLSILESEYRQQIAEKSSPMPILPRKTST